MCECGCYGNLGEFILRSPRGWYRLTLSPSCNNCSVGGSLVIDEVLPDNEPYLGWITDVNKLDVSGRGSLLACSPGPEELRKAMRLAVAGYKSDEPLDDYDADVLAESLLEHLPNWPTVLVAAEDSHE